MDLGLDFGTTHTVVAHGDRGNYPVVSFLDEDGDARDHFPSVVADDARHAGLRLRGAGGGPTRYAVRPLVQAPARRAPGHAGHADASR